MEERRAAAGKGGTEGERRTGGGGDGNKRNGKGIKQVRMKER